MLFYRILRLKRVTGVSREQGRLGRGLLFFNKRVYTVYETDEEEDSSRRKGSRKYGDRNRKSLGGPCAETSCRRRIKGIADPSGLLSINRSYRY